MQRKAVLFSAGEYNDSMMYKKPVLDLSGVKFDIMAMDKRLNQIGFSVVKKENITKAEYLPTLRDMTANSPSDAINIVYFSGHGGHYEGKNYICPSDFGVIYDKNNSISEASINIRDIVEIFKGKGKLILILDACRSDLGHSKGYFSEMLCSENVYIAYGTMFSETSIGITNAISWFTEGICDEILTPNIDVDALFTKVRLNILKKHQVQLPISVNGLLDSIVLHVQSDYDDIDKEIYDFVELYGDGYNAKYGYFKGEDLIFIDAAQFYNISLLDAYWKYTKVQNELALQKGIKMPMLTEDEYKIVRFLGFTRGNKHFSYDISHTWYYNGRQIRMGEIPPLPSSMQRKPPEKDKELLIEIEAHKKNDKIIIKTNIPDGCEISIIDNKNKFSIKYKVINGKIVIENATSITRIEICSGVFSDDDDLKKMLGVNNRNISGDLIEYHPIYGNQIKRTFIF